MLSLSALGEGANYAPFQKTDTEQFVEAVGTLIADPAKPQVATSPSTELGTVYGLASHYFEEHRQFWDKLELVVAFDRTDPRHAITKASLHPLAVRFVAAELADRWASELLTPMDRDEFAKQFAKRFRVIGVHAKGVGDSTEAGLERTQAALSNKLDPYLFDPTWSCLVAGTPSLSQTKHQLLNLALLAGVRTAFIANRPSATVAPTLWMSTPPPVRLSPAAVAEALFDADRAVVEGEDDDKPVLNPFIEPSTGRRNAFAQRLLRLATEPRQQHASPGATLLRRFAAQGSGDSHRRAAELADTLAANTLDWTNQRLWSLNLVPEIVNHDDRHVARVDQLAMQLAAELLDNGVLEPDDIYVLSCAAWLHDWGHAGARFGTGFPIHSLDVRALHGLLSARLVQDEQDRVQIARNLARAELLRSRVGLLVGHHQSKSCCGDGRIDLGLQLAAMRFGCQVKTLQDDLQNTGWTSDEGLRKAQILLGILRIADGADLGGHRVPFHRLDAGGAAESAGRTYVEGVSRRVLAMTSDRLRPHTHIGPVSDVAERLRDLLVSPQDERLTELLLDRVETYHQHVFELLGKGDVADRLESLALYEEVHRAGGTPSPGERKRLSLLLAEAANEVQAVVPRPVSEGAPKLVTRSSITAEHIMVLHELERLREYVTLYKAQFRDYFTKHAQVLSVRFERDGGAWFPLVMPKFPGDDAARKAVQVDVVREIFDEPSSRKAKLVPKPTTVALEEVGVTFGSRAELDT